MEHDSNAGSVHRISGLPQKWTVMTKVIEYTPKPGDIVVEQADIKSAILRRLGWTEENLSKYMYEVGCKYIDLLFTGFERTKVKARMERSKLFWSWFKNIWYATDYFLLEEQHTDRFVQLVLSHKEDGVFHGFYIFLHSADNTLAEHKIPRAVWDDVRKPEFITV